MIASDHSPAPPEMKAGEPLSAWGGIAGAQTTLQFVLGDGRLSATRVAEMVAGFPARRLGLAGKGRLAVGADADLVLVERAPHVLRAEDLRQRHQVSPFVGRRLHGRVVRTLLRGADPAPGTGRLLTPETERIPVT